jgi:predicted CoA-binding protein
MSQIQDFLAQPRIAVVGVSRDPQDFSRTLLKEFRTRGYDAVAVNPELDEVDGDRSFHNVRDIQPPVDGVILMTPPHLTEQVVHDCAEAHVSRVWMYRAGTKGGAVSEDAVRFCEKEGISVIPGECPFMFLPATGWFHRAHGFIRKITGHYPH